MGKFKITANRTSWSFYLTAANGENIAESSNSYTTKAMLYKGIESVRNVAPSAPIEDQTLPHYMPISNPKYELYRKCGTFYFDLRAQNGKILLISSAYKQKASCLKGIESIRKNAPTSEIKEEQ